MTDKRKHSRSRRTEDLSPAELREQIEEDKKKAGRSTVFLLAALVAIIVICIAWFVANTRVRVTTGTIGAQDSTLFELASVGKRQTAESKHLLDANGNQLLTSGTAQEYDTYKEWKDGEWNTVWSTQTYQKGTADLAWYLQTGNDTIAPGKSGKLEFYIIPKVSTLKSVEVTLNLEAYNVANTSGQTASSRTGNGKAEKSTDSTLQNLIQGHILLFQNLGSNTVGYSGWIENGKMQITPSGITTGNGTTSTSSESTFEQGVPYKVTVYWVWPKYFRNYIYNSRYEQEDLFGANVDSGTQNALLTYVKEQAEKKTNSTLFYNVDSAGNINISNPSSIGTSMSDTLLNECSEYYNAADEYIGTNADYLYVKAEAKAN